MTLVADSRTFGTVNTLTLALANLAAVDFALGWWPDAISNATDGLRLASETNQEATACYFQVMLAWIAALQGRAEDCRRLADQAVAAAIPRRLAAATASASWTLATLDLVTGQPAAALDRLLTLSTPQHPTAHAAIALLATGDLVEAAAHADAQKGLEPLVARIERLAAWDQQTWTLVTAARCRALITAGSAAEGHFRVALAVDGLDRLPLELARTKLLYGQWLRRARRRADARPHLRIALETFERLGAGPWAERARIELRASGQTARKRDLSTREQLTAQELQIAHLAQQGLANREIAAKLFLSVHTVSYHLHKIYGKLGIASRADLRQLDLDDGARN